MRIARPISIALRLSIIEGAAFGVYWNILLVIVINGLAVVLEATPMQFAMLNALPLLSQVFGLPAAKIMQEKDVRKPFTLWSEGISRSSWLLLLFIFILPDNPQLKVWFLIGVTAFAHITHAGGVVGWLSWISDLVPEEIRGIYFGVRGGLIGFVGLIGLSLASHWADTFNNRLKEAKELLSNDASSGADQAASLHAVEILKADYLHVISYLIIIAVFFALLSQFLLSMQPVRRMKKLLTTGYSAIWETLKSSNGRRILTAWIAIFFASGVTTGIFMQFFLNNLNISWQGITVYVWIVTVLSSAMTPIMGRLSDRFGYRNLLLMTWAGVWWQPLLSVFTPDNAPHVLGFLPLLIIVDAIAGGIFWPVVGIAQTNIVIAQTPSETRAGFFAVLNAIGGLVGFITAVLAGWLASTISVHEPWIFFGVTMDNLRIPMVAGAVLRLFASIFIMAIKEPPRLKEQVTGSVAFSAVWKILAGKPVVRH